jgi:hypothetical protein
MIDSGFIEEGPGSGGILALHKDMGAKLVARFLLGLASAFNSEIRYTKARTIYKSTLSFQSGWNMPIVPTIQ